MEEESLEGFRNIEFTLHTCNFRKLIEIPQTKIRDLLKGVDSYLYVKKKDLFEKAHVLFPLWKTNWI